MTRSNSPYLHAALISFIALFYAAIFIFTSGHMELTSMLATGTLPSDFWNNWSAFIAAGHMKFFGYALLVLAAISLLTMLVKKHKAYDEYQLTIFTRLLIIAGIVSLLMLPLIFFLLLSDPNYLIETIFLFAAIQSIALLIASCVYTLKY